MHIQPTCHHAGPLERRQHEASAAADIEHPATRERSYRPSQQRGDQGVAPAEPEVIRLDLRQQSIDGIRIVLLVSRAVEHEDTVIPYVYTPTRRAAHWCAARPNWESDTIIARTAQKNWRV